MSADSREGLQYYQERSLRLSEETLELNICAQACRRPLRTLFGLVLRKSRKHGPAVMHALALVVACCCFNSKPRTVL
jgi:hypothetical protein